MRQRCTKFNIRKSVRWFVIDRVWKVWEIMKNYKQSIDVFLAFLKLGLTSFGGPIAHIDCFHHEFVTKRKWLSQEAYVNLVALCNFLPGPASSQVGFAIGLSRAGYLGGLFAWFAFTLPSAIVLVLFSLSLSKHQHWL